MRFICLHCGHEFESGGTRETMRCWKCHLRQAIPYEAHRQAVDAAKAALRKVADSLPPHRPPIEVISDLPEALGPVLEMAKVTFPNPVIPAAFFMQILKEAAAELRDEKKQLKKATPAVSKRKPSPRRAAPEKPLPSRG